MKADQQCGRYPTPQALAEAERVLRLSTEQQRYHPAAVAADTAELQHINTYGPLPEFYLDQPFSCRQCGRWEIWLATAQKWYYETAKGHIQAQAVLCHGCRKAAARGGS
ncbi:zinc-ribbon domain containing protein [Pontibacter sp. JAM-7]|uniref:zinc-ribbon domain containing protein n=1 Tax=Pontibacter sp. JAM-7 TaxID=3366581 RepID=UPI003AF90314